MKRRVLVLFRSIASIVLVAVSTAAGAVNTPAATPAEWVPHDMIVPLQHLSKRYSCNDLWYKFHDVLLAIGARPDLRILTYRCERRLGSNARSPRVHLRFAMPRAVEDQRAREPHLSAIARTVHLAAGAPRSIDESDCVLLKQMKDTLLAALHVRVLSFSLDCQAPRNARPPFGLSVRALVPTPDRAIHAAFYR